MAARPTRKRTALLLYGILLVLPTVVLGGLHWHQLYLDHQLALENLPADARAAGERLAAAVRRQLEETLRAEAQRPFHYYAERILVEPADAESPMLARTPLADAEPPPGVLAWFSADLDPFLPGGRTEPAPTARASYVRAVDPAGIDAVARAAAVVVRHNVEIGFFARVARLANVRPTEDSWLVVAAFLAQFDERTGDPRELSDCFGRHTATLAAVDEPVVTTDFFLEIVRGPDGEPIASATRRVLPEEIPRQRPELGECRRALYRDFSLLQGVLLDLDWLLEQLPREHAGVLRADERYLPPGSPPPDPELVEFQPIDLAAALGFETSEPGVLGERGALVVAVERGQLERTYKGQMLRFLGVAAMLVLSLGTGLGLLLFSVNRELERAERTRNFVAAVTHELRTPLSTIALHAEMLLEGWAQTPERQREYYLRISRETQRLSTLVERVLEKSRLTGTSIAAEVHATGLETADLSAAVRAVRPMLTTPEVRGGEDLVFDLAEGLPPVELNHEAINSIVVNLVENARKYAPVPPGGEPIVVRTRADGGRVVLEVLDRGPGIPEDDRDRVFEAFYRIGNEATRTSQGTGLGLHLVDLQARALGGRVTVGDRPGGGAVFRIELPPSA